MATPGTLNAQPQLSYINKSYCKARRLPRPWILCPDGDASKIVGSEAPDFGISAGWTYRVDRRITIALPCPKPPVVGTGQVSYPSGH